MIRRALQDSNTCTCQRAIREVGSVHCIDCQRIVSENEERNEELTVDARVAGLRILPLSELVAEVPDDYEF